MQSPSKPPYSVDALLRVIEVRDAEVVLLKLMIEKLKLQLLRRLRAQFGPSSERLDDPQIALIEGAPLYELAPLEAAAKTDAANPPEVDRKLPAHLPRDSKLYRPETSANHHDTNGQACGCTACGGRLRLIGQDVSEQLEYVPAHFGAVVLFVQIGALCSKNPWPDNHLETRSCAAVRVFRADWCAF